MQLPRYLHLPDHPDGLHEWHIDGRPVYIDGRVPRDKHDALLEAYRVFQANPSKHNITDKGMRQMGFRIPRHGDFIVSYDPKHDETFIFPTR